MSAQPSDVHALARSQRQFLLDLLEKLVDAESPSSHPDAHRLVRSILQATLSESGIACRTVGNLQGAAHLLGRPRDRQPGAPLQLIVGHFDTVWPLGTTARRPFSVSGNTVLGPGTFDMKGGLVQLLIALRVNKQLGIEMPATPVIFLNADEEIGSRTSTRWISRLAARSARALVLEPALGRQGSLKTERKGVGRFTATVFGKAAHAGLDPEGGASAILELSHVIQKLFALNDADTGVSVNVGMIDGGLQANVIAPHSKAIIDVRVPTVADGRRVEEAIRSLRPETAGVRLQIEGGIGRPSMEATPRNSALWRQAKSLGTAIGLDLESARAGGGSDGNTTSQFTATLDGLGPVGDGAHAEHEYLCIDQTLDRAALLALLLASPVLPVEQQE